MSDEIEAVLLRDMFVFKIVPMLNPDGVVVGNYRSSLGGYDLNRQWQNPSMRNSPEIHSMKDMIRKTLECRKIEMFVDIHGHSRQKNIFLYGCSKSQIGPHLQALSETLAQQQASFQIEKKPGKQGINGGSGQMSTMQGGMIASLTTKEKIFPWLMTQNCEDFSFYNCLFGLHKSKESTGRAVIFKEFNVQNSYTLECSFCGPNQGSKADCHFSIKNLIHLGETFAKTILEFSNMKAHKQIIPLLENFYKTGCKQLPISRIFDFKTLLQNDKDLQKAVKKLETQKRFQIEAEPDGGSLLSNKDNATTNQSSKHIQRDSDQSPSKQIKKKRNNFQKPFSLGQTVPLENNGIKMGSPLISQSPLPNDTDSKDISQIFINNSAQLMSMPITRHIEIQRNSISSQMQRIKEERDLLTNCLGTNIEEESVSRRERSPAINKTQIVQFTTPALLVTGSQFSPKKLSNHTNQNELGFQNEQLRLEGTKIKNNLTNQKPQVRKLAKLPTKIEKIVEQDVELMKKSKKDRNKVKKEGGDLLIQSKSQQQLKAVGEKGSVKKGKGVSKLGQ